MKKSYDLIPKQTVNLDEMKHARLKYFTKLQDIWQRAKNEVKKSYDLIPKQTVNLDEIEIFHKIPPPHPQGDPQVRPRLTTAEKRAGHVRSVFSATSSSGSPATSLHSSRDYA